MLKASIVGSGNWGAAISTIICRNALLHEMFHSEVSQWVFEEMVDGQRLTHVINTTRQNVKYLPGVQLPNNLRVNPNLQESVADADLLIFVLPHQFLPKVLEDLVEGGRVKPTARAISLIKGFYAEKGRPCLFSQLIAQSLGIECSVLSGANVANGVAKGDFSETTIGYVSLESARVWSLLFDAPWFKVNALPDICGIELCGAVKNVIALAAGFCDGLDFSSNTKAALIRLGVEEMRLFANVFFEGILEDTFYDSAGYADIITTCFGGRHVKCAAEFVRRRAKDIVSDPQADEELWLEIEKEKLRGGKLQGTLTAKDVFRIIEHHNLFDAFPLLMTTYQVAFRGLPADRVMKVFMTDTPRRLKPLQECTPCPTTDQLRQLRTSVSTKE